jgi:hypothetical protein
METIKIRTNQENYVDYSAAEVARLAGWKKLTLTPKIVEYDGEKVVLMHLGGVDSANGSILNVDFWPKRSATAEDLAKLPVQFEDITYRIGIHTEKHFEDVVDPETGETKRKKVVTKHYSQPKFVSYFVDGKEVKFTGKRSVFDENLGHSVWVEDEEEDSKQESTEAPAEEQKEQA